MGLSFLYEFTAPAATLASELEAFLRDVERKAQALGFDPTIVLNVPFDTPERREFANRLGGNLTLQDERLKSFAIPAPGQLRNHDPESGEYRLFPEHGVVLVVIDERGCESCFGFFNSRSTSSTSTVRFSRLPVFKAVGGSAISWIHLIRATGQSLRISANGDLSGRRRMSSRDSENPTPRHPRRPRCPSEYGTRIRSRRLLRDISNNHKLFATKYLRKNLVRPRIVKRLWKVAKTV